MAKRLNLDPADPAGAAAYDFYHDRLARNRRPDREGAQTIIDAPREIDPATYATIPRRGLPTRRTWTRSRHLVIWTASRIVNPGMGSGRRGARWAAGRIQVRQAQEAHVGIPWDARTPFERWVEDDLKLRCTAATRPRSARASGGPGPVSAGAMIQAPARSFIRRFGALDGEGARQYHHVSLLHGRHCHAAAMAAANARVGTACPAVHTQTIHPEPRGSTRGGVC